ncbi:hypothetical protein LG943_00865 [Streptomonospora sp. S1-112]|uniref:Uncharacterized protein n=1 Tax=Streptomonospora mangrovi TaxID=2883123 RepID=A0A9X3NLW1_9ACTN|nr:hypothetical protein [Streptomonospora mangrovi]MDA0562895.1 hypothetical protein [Streptomonospora mangrovi]
MDVRKSYAQLHSGVRFVIDTIENGYRLPQPLEGELHHWVISQWERMRDNIEWCDDDQDLVAVTTDLTHLAESYRDLRKALFSDLLHFGPEPPWRRINADLAVRLPLQVHLNSSEYYMLRARGGNRWTFSVYGSARPEQGGSATSSEFEVELTENTCVIPAEFEGHRLLSQLFYGLRLMKDEHYFMRTPQDHVLMEAERIVHTEADDSGWE